MSGTPRHGTNAAIFIDTSSGGSSAAIQISSKNGWTFDNSRDFVDTTAFQDTTKSAAPGLANATGTISGFNDFGDTTIYNIIGASTERRLYIYPDFINNSTTYVAGKAFFSGKAAGTTTSIVSFDLDFQSGSSGINWVHP